MLRRVSLLFPLLAWLLAACGGSEASPAPTLLDGAAPGASTALAEAPAIPADAPLVAFLGDSISAGLHLSAEEAFPAVLQRELAAAGHPFRLLNAGVSGDTSAGGLRRVGWLLKQAPSVLVVELGGNDGLRGQDLAAVERNLRGIITAAQAGGARVLLLGMRLPPSYGATYTRGFEELYERLAREHEVAFVPFFMRDVGGVPALNLADGLHPSAEGHRILARNIRPALEELLGEL